MIAFIASDDQAGESVAMSSPEIHISSSALSRNRASQHAMCNSKSTQISSSKAVQHYLTVRSPTAKDVEPVVIARRESVAGPVVRQGAVEEGVGAAPRRQLGASDGAQAGEDRNTQQAARS
jgi:hypothetical protein